jgi:beta-glucosidase-like glycosyl hydrolase
LIALLAGLLAIALSVFGLTRGTGGRDPLPVATVKKTPTPRPAAPAASPRAPAAPAAPAVPAAVRAQADRMSRTQQVAQLLLVGFEGTDLTAPIFRELRTRGWGGLLMTSDNVLSPDQGAVLAGEARAVARIPPLVATDGVAGFELPPQSPEDSVRAVRADARSRAARFRAAGVNLVFAPRADVGVEASEGTFGDDPQQVARLAKAAAEGWRAGRVIAAPGRFPGEGAVNQDPVEGPATVGLSPEELELRDLVPFRALARRSRAVVVSSAAFPAYDPVTPAALTPAIVRGLLREELKFTGVAISDDLAGLTAATGATPGRAAVAALRAGVDMVQVPDPAQREPVLRAILAARIPPARLREALLRVLAMKRAAGLRGTSGRG